MDFFKDLDTDRLTLKCIGHDDDEFFCKQFSTPKVNEYLYDAEPVSGV